MKWNSPAIAPLALLLLGIWFWPEAARQEGSCPAAPGEPGWMEQQMRQREDNVGRERDRAIELLKEFLKIYPKADQRADALFRLAELNWERSEASLLESMRRYDSALDSFRSGTTKDRPPEPRIDLAESIKVYEEILEKHHDFAQTDLVLYLYGFALNEQGEEDTALSIYRSLIQRFPGSAFVPDAHLALGEYYFAKGNYTPARQSYEQVLLHPDSPLYDLAVYKTAWCYFKEGNAKEAALRFRDVLRRARAEKSRGEKRVEASASSLEKEALEDLALTFSESGGAKEAYRFMEQVGGEEYSIRVLRSLGEVFFRQARYDEAVETFRTLVARFPLSEDSPEHQARIAEAFQKKGKMEEALAERRKLAEHYAPGSSWQIQNKDKKEALEKATALCEESLRFVALYRHKQAQEKKSNEAYLASSQAYQEYLKAFPEAPESARMHFNLGEVLFKLGKFDQAAIHYGEAARKSADPVLKKDSAYAAILAYDRLRQRDGSADREPPAKEEALSSAEAGFVRVVEEYGSIAPDDEKLPQLRFEVGRVFYSRAQYARASAQLLAVVEKYPKDKFAEPSADLAMDCFSRSKDWPSLERRSRDFLKQGLFAGKDLGKKLPGFITGAIFQNATALSQSGKHRDAASEYERLVAEFPGDPLAPKALFYEAVSLDLAGEKQKAVAAYQRIIEHYPDKAADALFVIAGIYERQYDYEKAARSYSDFSERFKDDPRAPDTLLQAARLDSARKAFQEEARLLVRFTQTYPAHPRTPDALYEAGLALEKAGNTAEAERTFATYLERHAEKQERSRQATFHLGQTQLNQGKAQAARAHFERCGNFGPKNTPTGPELEAAAHCRFMLGELVFAEYQKIELRPPKNRLVQLLKDKATLLKKAEGLFTQVVAAGQMEWGSAALFRIGDMYSQFAQAIYKAPMPTDLNAQELEVYRQELQSLAYPIEDKAMTAFTLSREVAIRNQYYSRWSQKTIEMLRNLDPAKYPKEEEVRPGLRWADSLTTFPLLLKPLAVPPKPPPVPLGGAK